MAPRTSRRGAAPRPLLGPAGRLHHAETATRTGIASSTYRFRRAIKMASGRATVGGRCAVAASLIRWAGRQRVELRVPSSGCGRAWSRNRRADRNMIDLRTARMTPTMPAHSAKAPQVVRCTAMIRAALAKLQTIKNITGPHSAEPLDCWTTFTYACIKDHGSRGLAEAPAVAFCCCAGGAAGRSVPRESAFRPR